MLLGYSAIAFMTLLLGVFIAHTIKGLILAFQTSRILGLIIVFLCIFSQVGLLVAFFFGVASWWFNVNLAERLAKAWRL